MSGDISTVMLSWCAGRFMVWSLCGRRDKSERIVQAACRAKPPTLARMEKFDVVIVGAGAAGLFCAGVAGQLGLKVLLLDHAPKVAEKVRISGGGRCNFTNRDLNPRQPQQHYVGANPQFCRSALSRYQPADFIELLQRHGVTNLLTSLT